MARQGAVGLDLSLRSTGACWLPRGWTGDTGQARVMTCGRECDGTERDKARRRADVASAVLAFVARHAAPGGAVYVEEYAHAMGKEANAAQLRELGGVVKHVLLVDLGVEVIPVVASQARKTMLGKLPRKDVKDWTIANVRRLKGAAIYWNDDQIDALVIANMGLVLQGMPSLAFPGEDV